MFSLISFSQNVELAETQKVQLVWQHLFSLIILYFIFSCVHIFCAWIKNTAASKPKSLDLHSILVSQIYQSSISCPFLASHCSSLSSCLYFFSLSCFSSLFECWYMTEACWSKLHLFEVMLVTKWISSPWNGKQLTRIFSFFWLKKHLWLYPSLWFKQIRWRRMSLGEALWWVSG